MSLFPAFVGAQKRQEEQAPTPEPAAEQSSAETPRDDDSDIFNLLPPLESGAEPPPPPLPPKPIGRNQHPVDMTDLSRLSIDREGRLYWDGKPVETHHRFAMSRKQFIGASVVAAFVIIGSIGAALQGAATVRGWACRLGWSVSACDMPEFRPSRIGAEIPA